MQARRASEGTMFSVRIRSSVTKLDQVVSTNESILMPIGISGPRVTRRPSVTFPPLTRKRKIIQRSHIEERLPLMLATFLRATIITWHQRWSSHTGYLSNTESNTSCIHWRIKATLDVHHSTWLTLGSQSLNPVVDPAWGSPTPLTTSNVALELNSVNGASVTLVQLPDISYLTVLSLPLTPIDFKIFQKLVSFTSRFDIC